MLAACLSFAVATGIAQPNIQQSEVAPGIVTLYSRDSLATSLGFRDGAIGRLFQHNEVREGRRRFSIIKKFPVEYLGVLIEQ
ncbi:MAG: hypothetical protein AB7J13_17380, partial [Pyrinomonadaceae bacterium]